MVKEGTVPVPRTVPVLSGMMMYYLFSYCDTCLGVALPVQELYSCYGS